MYSLSDSLITLGLSSALFCFVRFLQEHDYLTPEDIKFEVVSEKQPTKEELDDLKFAWRCVKHVKSNAITIAKGKR